MPIYVICETEYTELENTNEAYMILATTDVREAITSFLGLYGTTQIGYTYLTRYMEIWNNNKYLKTFYSDSYSTSDLINFMKNLGVSESDLLTPLEKGE